MSLRRRHWNGKSRFSGLSCLAHDLRGIIRSIHDTLEHLPGLGSLDVRIGSVRHTCRQGHRMRRSLERADVRHGRAVAQQCGLARRRLLNLYPKALNVFPFSPDPPAAIFSSPVVHSGTRFLHLSHIRTPQWHVRWSIRPRRSCDFTSLHARSSKARTEP